MGVNKDHGKGNVDGPKFKHHGHGIFGVEFIRLDAVGNEKLTALEQDERKSKSRFERSQDLRQSSRAYLGLATRLPLDFSVVLANKRT
jgi:hypothetical protein